MLDKVEKALGLPSLERVAETLKSFPDSERLKMIRLILGDARSIKLGPQEFEALLKIMEAMRDTPTERLVAFRDILKELRALVKMLPKEGLQELPSLIAELKKDAGLI